MHPRLLTRRQLLTRLGPGLALGVLLPACGAFTPTRPSTPMPVPQGGAATATRATPASTRTAISPPSVTAVPGTAAIRPIPTPTSALEGEGCWRAGGFQPSPQPADPYRGGAVSEGVAFSFAQGVRELSSLVVLGLVSERLDARWATQDGRRPENPHTSRFGIITPVRVTVEQVAKGSYTLPEIYLSAPGGVVGQDCAYYSGSGPRASYPVGRRVLYLLTDDKELAAVAAVSGDDRYRYFRARQSYVVAGDGTITIGPEYDIMGHRYDDPPRTLPVADALREIAALLTAPSTTPTR